MPGPGVCKCGNDKFYIQYDKNLKTSKAIFRYINKNCRYRHQICINFFYSNYPQLELKTVSEIIKCFLALEMNAVAIQNYLNTTYQKNINISAISKILQDIRDILYHYYNIEYQSNLLGEKNAHGTFSVDEALFTHKTNGEKNLDFIIYN